MDTQRLELLEKALIAVNGLTFLATDLDDKVMNEIYVISHRALGYCKADICQNTQCINDILEMLKKENICDWTKYTSNKGNEMQQLTQQIVESTVDDLVNAGKTFSAYDVVTELRHLGYWSERSFVNPIVFAHVAKYGSYDKKYVDNPGYWQFMPAVVQHVMPVAPTVNQPVTTNLLPDTVLTVGSENRVVIPAVYLDAIGVQDMDVVEQLKSSQQVLLKAGDGTGENWLTPDEHMNVRVRLGNVSVRQVKLSQKDSDTLVLTW